MNTHVRILTGTRAGESIPLSSSPITVGRHPEADLRFDPENELSVSARHAILFEQEGQWHVRDLASRNGTLVNGQPVRGAVQLRHGDRLRFGADGPAVELSIGQAAGVAADGQERGRSAVWRRAVAGLVVVVLLATVAGLMMLGARREAAWNLERRAMQLQIDSLEWARAQTVEALERQLMDVTESLQRSQGRVRSLEVALQGAESRGEAGADEVETLRRELQMATSALQGQETAANLDFRAIQEQNRRAVARVFVEFADGEVITATAFAVRADATLLTSRHVLHGADGSRRPRRIAIQFSDSEQVWPARVLGTSLEADLAAVKVDNILGDAPVVQAFNLRPDTLPSGTPVAMLGFPLGGAPPTSGSADGIARPHLAAGVIRSMGTAQVEVQGYGAVGASGSPIFDARGEVVAIVFGGRTEDGSHALFGIPSTTAVRFVASLR